MDTHTTTRTSPIVLRPAGQRGQTRIGWLDSRHTFSFGEYYDERHMGFRTLRVINDDRVEPGAGFGEHAHRDMEIITYVLDGELEHKDSLGNGNTIHRGDIQVMTAGTGIRHAEYNPSRTTPVHFIQIWIEPAARGLPPRYEDRHFAEQHGGGRLALIAGPDGPTTVARINQDAYVLAGNLNPGERVTHELPANRFAWLHVARGAVTLNDLTMTDGDGAAITGPLPLQITGGPDGGEVLLFDLA